VLKCGNYDYDPATHFCTRAKVEENKTAVPLCGVKGYDTRTQVCEGSIVKTLFTDPRDSTKYKSVKIGEQTWMAENLNYKVGGSKCYSNNDANCAIYGRLYDHETALDICPEVLLEQAIN